jgi:hypothetical protein
LNDTPEAVNWIPQGWILNKMKIQTREWVAKGDTRSTCVKAHMLGSDFLLRDVIKKEQERKVMTYGFKTRICHEGTIVGAWNEFSKP